MRLRKYLQEKDVVELSNEVSDFNDKIQKDCQEYLKLIKGHFPLFRGMERIKDYYGKKKVRKDRRSKGMTKEVFEEFNKWLENNGHNRRDMAISVITDPTVAGNFGEACYVFPIGRMSYSWVMAEDVNLDDRETGWGGLAAQKYFEDNIDLTEKGFENYFFTDEGFDKAYKNGWEIWINCDSYYFISAYKLKGFAKWDENEQRFKM